MTEELQIQVDKLSEAITLNTELTLRFKTLEASLLLCNREEHWLRSNARASSGSRKIESTDMPEGENGRI